MAIHIHKEGRKVQEKQTASTFLSTKRMESSAKFRSRLPSGGCAIGELQVVDSAGWELADFLALLIVVSYPHTLRFGGAKMLTW